MSARRGSALIMAVALLAALLLLGLPFLFMQSSSLAGARSLAAKQQAQAVVEGLRAYAVAVGATAIEASVAEGGSATAAWSDLRTATAALGLGSASAGSTIPNRIDLDLARVAGSPGVPLTALSIEDEQGKLDANRLGPAGWARLFAILGIADWDDGAVDAGQRIAAGYSYTVAGIPYPSNDTDDFTQLAQAIANRRSAIGPFRCLEDLQRADPGYNTDATPIFRTPLTAAELERLRPYLTFSALAQARGGVIDGGTVIGKDPANPANIIVDDLPPFRVDAWFVSENLNGQGRHLETVATAPSTITGTWATANGFADLGQAILLAPMASVNLHQATGTVRQWWATTLPATPAIPLTTRGDLAAINAWIYTNPHWYADREHPQLDIASSGWFALTARADILDRAGNLLAGASRRAVVQAVPQEGRLERRWERQDDLEFQRRARTMPGMASWPMAVERFSDLAPHSGAVRDGDGLTFAPLATNTWTLPTASATGATVVQTALQGTLSDSGGNVSRARTAALMGPDGLRLNDASDPAVRLQLAAGNVFPGTSRIVLTCWIRPDEDWTGLVPLIDSRCRSSSIAYALVDGVDGDASRQNQFGLYYDATNSAGAALVLTYAPPGAEITTTLAQTIQGDDPRTPAVDERSLAGDTTLADWLSPAPVTQPFGNLGSVSGAWAPHRVIHLYATPGGLDKGQWYRIQVVMADAKPGGIALVVDGCAGRGTQRIPASDTTYQVAWGDQCTLPAAILDQDLPIADPTLTWPSGSVPPANSYWIDRIAIALPALAQRRGLSVASLLPSRGAVRIGNEYIAYQGITPDGSGASATLDRCRRHVRTPFQSTTTVPAQARGGVVLPDGFIDTATLPSPRTGGATTAAAFEAAGYPVTTFLATGTPEVPPSLTIADPAHWPATGIVKLQQGAGRWFRTFIRSGSTLTISPAPTTVFAEITPVFADQGVWSGTVGGTAQACSLEITVGGSDIPTADAFLLRHGEPYLVQIGDPHGTIEWIAVDGSASATIGGALRHFLFRTDGWLSGGRAQRRTQANAFPAGATVLPVQRATATRYRSGDQVSLFASNGTAITCFVRYFPEDDPNTGTSLWGIPMLSFDRRLDTQTNSFPANWPNPSDVCTLVSGYGWSNGTAGPVQPAWLDAGMALGSFLDSTAPAGRATSVDAITSTALATLPTLPTVTQAQVGSSATSAILASDAVSSSSATLIIGVSASPPGSSGLALVDGEVMAWHQYYALTPPNPPNASMVSGIPLVIIGRGLLGSGRRDHQVADIPFLPLPDWTVHQVRAGATGQAKLTASIAINTWFDIEAGDGSLANLGTGGLAMLCDPNGGAGRFELMMLRQNPYPFTSPSSTNPDYLRYTTTDWLRGLYRTAPRNWSTDPLPPLVLGWSPRYQSALPAVFPSSAADTARLLRCRAYPAAGFPLRWHGMHMPASNAATVGTPAGGLLAILDTAASATMRPELRLLTCAFEDGVDHRFDAWPAGHGSIADLNAAIAADANTATDGAELRVSWRYMDRLDATSLPTEDPFGFRALARGMNRTPALAGASLRAQVPVRTLATDGAR